MKILLVDDDDEIRRMVAAFLRQVGYEVVACGTFWEGWETFQQGEFKVVLLDWMLPDGNGLELCQWIRNSSRGDTTVVIVVTANGSREDFDAILESNADDYLSKPFDLGMIEAHVRLAVRRAGDLVDNKERIESRQQSADLNAATLECNPLTIIALDREDTVLSVNGKFLRSHPLDPSETPGCTIHEFLGDLLQSPTSLRSTIAEVRRLGAPAKLDSQCLNSPSGDVRIVDIYVAPIRSFSPQDGQRLMISIQDMTELRSSAHGTGHVCPLLNRD